MDLRSERAIALLGEFLDSEDVWIPDPQHHPRENVYNAESDVNNMSNRVKHHKHAEHFAHGESKSPAQSDLLSLISDI